MTFIEKMRHEAAPDVSGGSGDGDTHGPTVRRAVPLCVDGPGHNGVVITSGVDLATVPQRTGLCVIDWNSSRCAEITVGVDDTAIVEAALQSARCGIDAPFGYPDAFVDFVAAHAAGEDATPDELTEPYRLRMTDLAVWRTHGRRPLSVSTDLIGVTALRCARIQVLVARRTGRSVDRTGGGVLAEVYPAATLTAWGLPASRYKVRSDAGRALLARLAAEVVDRFSLDVDDRQRALLSSSDHAFDAMVAAVTAREVAAGRTQRPPPELAHVAQREGWIHVPVL